MKLQKNGARRAVQIVAGIVVLSVVFWMGTRFGGGRGYQAEESPPAAGVEKPVQIWTCSMHPQIRMTKPGKCPVCSMDLIPLVSSPNGPGEDTSHAVRLTMAENARKLAGITAVPAVRRGLTSDIRLTGKVALDETRVEMITARVGGRIDRLYVDYTGVMVAEGDHLAEMYSPELVSLQRELIESAKALSGAQGSDEVKASLSRTFDAAKEKLRLLGFADNDMDEVLRRGTNSDHMTIRAGQSGVVLKKLVDEGAYVQTGTPLFHIADLRKLWLKLDAYESDLIWLRLGQKVEFSVEAWPGESFGGSVSFIDPVVDPMTRTVKVRVIVDNRDGRLKPDMFVKAQVMASLSKSGSVKNSELRGKWLCPMHPQIVKADAGTCDICGMPLVKAEELGYVTSGFEEVNPLVVPATAVLYTGERSVVYVAVPDAAQPTYEARTVELGPRVGSYYIIKSGVAEGEQVVVNGSFKIDAELQIQAKPSMMDPAEEPAVPMQGAAGMKDMKGMRQPSVVAGGEQIPAIGTGEVTASFKADLEKLNIIYFALANALANDNADSAKEDVIALKNMAAKITSPKGRQYAAWQSVKKALAQDLEHARHAADLSDVRVLFDNVSREMIVLEKQYGHVAEGSHYLAFCPMAFDNKGAYWLQTASKIRNPYYGAKMLGCGEIRETFGKKKQEAK